MLADTPLAVRPASALLAIHEVRSHAVRPSLRLAEADAVRPSAACPARIADLTIPAYELPCSIRVTWCTSKLTASVKLPVA
eukprot:498893-Hanusia_phi.AAC.1